MNMIFLDVSGVSQYLIDVRDKFSLSWHVNFLVVCSHLALDGEEENLQVSFLCESVKKEITCVYHIA